jgi:hypothetical protein
MERKLRYGRFGRIDLSGSSSGGSYSIGGDSGKGGDRRDAIRMRQW